MCCGGLKVDPCAKTPSATATRDRHRRRIVRSFSSATDAPRCSARPTARLPCSSHTWSSPRASASGWSSLQHRPVHRVDLPRQRRLLAAGLQLRSRLQRGFLRRLRARLRLLPRVRHRVQDRARLRRQQGLHRRHLQQGPRLRTRADGRDLHRRRSVQPGRHLPRRLVQAARAPRL